MRRVLGSLGVVWLAACGPGAPAGTGEGVVVTTGAGPDTGQVPPTTGGHEPGPTTSMSTGTGAGTGTSSGAVMATSGGSETTGTSGGATTGEVSTGTHNSSGETGVSIADLPHPVCDSRKKDCAPVDCEVHNCGELSSPYDEQGLRRADCGSQHCCAPGFECFRPAAWFNVCVSSIWSCQGIQSDDCWGDFCVPESLGPPPFECGTSDEAECVAAGCTFVMAPFPFELGDDCECGPAIPQCLWFPEAVDSVEKPTAYYPDTGNDVRVFPREWSAPPFGWHLCAGDPDAPKDCDCFGKCVP